MAEAVLDANVLLRHLTDAPRALAERVGQILDAAEARSVTLIVAPLTLAEVVFVLESVYRWNRKEIADRLLAFISSSAVDFLEKETVAQALTWYRDFGTVHFADAYVAALAARRNCPLISLDRGLKRLPGLRIVDTQADI